MSLAFSRAALLVVPALMLPLALHAAPPSKHSDPNGRQEAADEMGQMADNDDGHGHGMKGDHGGGNCDFDDPDDKNGDHNGDDGPGRGDEHGHHGDRGHGHGHHCPVSP